MINNISVASAYSPPFRIVSKYFISSIASFVVLNFLLLFNYHDISGHHFQPKILSITHITTLGFITMIIFGAMFQLVPVVLEVKLFSSLLDEIQFWIYLTGVVLLTTKFWFFNINYSFTFPAILLNAAMGLFSINIIFSMFKVKNWNITGTYFAASIFWLIITAIAGLLLAMNLDKPFFKISHFQYLKLHVITAFVGWVGMVIMGVSFKLIPMFTLSHNYKMIYGKITVVIINIGLLGVNWIMHYKDVGLYNLIFGSMIFAGFILYFIQIYLIFKNRIRKKLDSGLKFSAVAFILMGLTTILNFSFLFFEYESTKNLTLIYGLIALFGSFGMLIIGQMYKIVPFLVWYHKYSSKVGIQNVPMLKDMFDEKLANYQLIVMLGGIINASIGFFLDLKFVIFLGFLLLFISSLIFAYNMFKIYRS